MNRLQCLMLGLRNIQAAGTSEGVKKSWETRRGALAGPYTGYQGTAEDRNKQYSRSGALTAASRDAHHEAYAWHQGKSMDAYDSGDEKTSRLHMKASAAHMKAFTFKEGTPQFERASIAARQATKDVYSKLRRPIKRQEHEIEPPPTGGSGAY
jgi:hypothetical protein